jgi:hypothetical protein
MASQFSLSARIQNSQALRAAPVQGSIAASDFRDISAGHSAVHSMSAPAAALRTRNFFVGIFETFRKLFRIWDSWRREYRRS